MTYEECEDSSSTYVSMEKTSSTSTTASSCLPNKLRGCVRKVPFIGKEGPTIRFPKAILLILVLTSAAQYAGTTAISLLITTTLRYGPVQTNDFWMYMGFVGFASPLLGYFSDTFTPLGERRRPCLALGFALNGTLMILQSLYATQMTYFHFVLLSLAQTVSEMVVFIPINAMIVELCQNPAHMHSILKASREGGDAGEEDEKSTASDSDDRPYQLSQEEKTKASGAGQSTAMLVRSGGSLLGGILQTIALTKVDPRGPILGAGVAYLACIILIPWLPKHCTSEQDALTIVGQPFLTRMKELKFRLRSAAAGGVVKSQFSGLIGLVVFVFVYSVMPSATTIYFQFVSVNFWFSDAFLSATNLAGLAASILACYLYQWKLSQRNQVFIFVVGCAAMSLGYVTNIMLATGFSKNTLGISDHAFVVLDTTFVSFLSRIAFMPVLQLASSRCPKGFEAVIFEFFTATSLGASSVSALITSIIATKLQIETSHYERLWILLVICAISKWVPVFFLGCLPKVTKKNDDNADAHGVPGQVEAEGGSDRSMQTAVDSRTEVETAAKEQFKEGHLSAPLNA